MTKNFTTLLVATKFDVTRLCVLYKVTGNGFECMRNVIVKVYVRNTTV